MTLKDKIVVGRKVAKLMKAVTETLSNQVLLSEKMQQECEEMYFLFDVTETTVTGIVYHIYISSTIEGVLGKDRINYCFPNIAEKLPLDVIKKAFSLQGFFPTEHEELPADSILLKLYLK